MANSDIARGLKACELFALLDEAEVEELARTLDGSCRMEQYKAGDVIFAQGEYRTMMYVLVEGQVMLQRTFYLGEREAITPVAVLGKGRAMGWAALLYGPCYGMASAICQKPSLVIAIEGTALRSALEQESSLGFRVMTRLACMLGDRLQAAFSAAECHL